MSAENINVTLPDGSTRTYAIGTTGLEVAQSISQGLARAALTITIDGVISELSSSISKDVHIAINTWDSDEGKASFWHSSAHILAEAVQELYPLAKFAIGPSIETGFYYDIDFGDAKVGLEDLGAIEVKFLEMARKKSVFEGRNVPKAEALAYYSSQQDNEFKREMIENLPDGEITFYEQGNFTDLCRGGHIPNTGLVKAIKLTNLAGAYWRGDSEGQQLTRIYGVSFPKQKMLDEYITQMEEAQKRDHKKLGKQLGIYMIDPLIGAGLPVWLPNGTLLRRTLEDFLRKEQVKRGYQEVITPHIGNLELYKISGHYPYYADSQYNPIVVDNEEYLLKPMNCPHHHRIYANSMHSYRDLPVRLAEFGSVYRYEQSGELNGLSRVRGFTQDDAHIYCTHGQLKDEIKSTIELTQMVFKTFDMPVDIRLSFRDDESDKYGGDVKLWDLAQAEIKEVVDEMGLNYKIALGEASFYGPKIDFIIRDAIGRKWQLGTVQVDYVMPERFDLTYIGSDNAKHRPVIIHRAPFGSMERFTSILIEHFAGDFPLWLSPTQLSILPISEDFNDFAQKLAEQLQEQGVRVHTDYRNEQIGAKIKEAEQAKIPYMAIIGAKEVEANAVALRRHKKGNIGSFGINDFVVKLLEQINSKSLVDFYQTESPSN